MYKLICCNLSKSNRSLTNFTSTYKQVAQNYENNRLINLSKKKFVSETELQDEENAEIPELPEHKTNTIEEETSQDARPKSCGSFFTKKMGCRVSKHPLLGMEKYSNNDKFGAYSTNPSRYFYSSQTSQNQHSTTKKKPFKNKEAADLYKSALEQCMKIRVKKCTVDKYYKRTNWISQAVKPASWEDKIAEKKAEAHATVTPRSAKSRASSFVYVYPEVRRKRAPEAAVAAKTAAPKARPHMTHEANHQLARRKFKITYPTHQVKYKLNFVKPHNIEQLKSANSHADNLVRPMRSRHAKKYKYPVIQNSHDMVLLMQNATKLKPEEEVQQADEKSEAEWEDVLMRQHPVVKKASKRSKMAIYKTYNKLLYKIHQRKYGEDEMTASVPEGDAAEDAEKKMAEETENADKSKEAEEIENADESKEAEETWHEPRIMRHPMVAISPLNMGLRNPRTVLAERNDTYDIDNICVKANENSTTKTKYGDYIVEMDRKAPKAEVENNFLKQQPTVKAAQPQPEIKPIETQKDEEPSVAKEILPETDAKEINSEEAKQPLRQKGPVESLAEYLKKLKQLEEQTAVRGFNLKKPAVSEMAKRLDVSSNRATPRPQAVEEHKKGEDVKQPDAIATAKPEEPATKQYPLIEKSAHHDAHGLDSAETVSAHENPIDSYKMEKLDKPAAATLAKEFGKSDAASAKKKLPTRPIYSAINLAKSRQVLKRILGESIVKRVKAQAQAILDKEPKHEERPAEKTDRTVTENMCKQVLKQIHSDAIAKRVLEQNMKLNMRKLKQQQPPKHLPEKTAETASSAKSRHVLKPIQEQTLGERAEAYRQALLGQKMTSNTAERAHTVTEKHLTMRKVLKLAQDEAVAKKAEAYRQSLLGQKTTSHAEGTARIASENNLAKSGEEIYGEAVAERADPHVHDLLKQKTKLNIGEQAKTASEANLAKSRAVLKEIQGEAITKRVQAHAEALLEQKTKATMDEQARTIWKTSLARSREVLKQIQGEAIAERVQAHAEALIDQKTKANMETVSKTNLARSREVLKEIQGEAIAERVQAHAEAILEQKKISNPKETVADNQPKERRGSEASASVATIKIVAVPHLHNKITIESYGSKEKSISEAPEHKPSKVAAGNHPSKGKTTYEALAAKEKSRIAAKNLDPIANAAEHRQPKEKITDKAAQEVEQTSAKTSAPRNSMENLLKIMDRYQVQQSDVPKVQNDPNTALSESKLDQAAIKRINKRRRRLRQQQQKKQMERFTRKDEAPKTPHQFQLPKNEEEGKNIAETKNKNTSSLNRLVINTDVPLPTATRRDKHKFELTEADASQGSPASISNAGREKELQSEIRPAPQPAADGKENKLEASSPSTDKTMGSEVRPAEVKSGGTNRLDQWHGNKQEGSLSTTKIKNNQNQPRRIIEIGSPPKPQKQNAEEKHKYRLAEKELGSDASQVHFLIELPEDKVKTKDEKQKTNQIGNEQTGTDKKQKNPGPKGQVRQMVSAEVITKGALEEAPRKEVSPPEKPIIKAPAHPRDTARYLQERKLESELEELANKVRMRENYAKLMEAGRQLVRPVPQEAAKEADPSCELDEKKGNNRPSIRRDPPKPEPKGKIKKDKPKTKKDMVLPPKGHNDPKIRNTDFSTVTELSSSTTEAKRKMICSSEDKYEIVSLEGLMTCKSLAELVEEQRQIMLNEINDKLAHTRRVNEMKIKNLLETKKTDTAVAAPNDAELARQEERVEIGKCDAVVSAKRASTQVVQEIYEEPTKQSEGVEKISTDTPPTGNSNVETVAQYSVPDVERPVRSETRELAPIAAAASSEWPKTDVTSASAAPAVAATELLSEEHNTEQPTKAAKNEETSPSSENLELVANQTNAEEQTTEDASRNDVSTAADESTAKYEASKSRNVEIPTSDADGFPNLKMNTRKYAKYGNIMDAQRRPPKSSWKDIQDIIRPKAAGPKPGYTHPFIEGTNNLAVTFGTALPIAGRTVSEVAKGIKEQKALKSEAGGDIVRRETVEKAEDQKALAEEAQTADALPPMLKKKHIKTSPEDVGAHKTERLEWLEDYTALDQIEQRKTAKEARRLVSKEEWIRSLGITATEIAESPSPDTVASEDPHILMKKHVKKSAIPLRIPQSPTTTERTASSRSINAPSPRQSSLDAAAAQSARNAKAPIPVPSRRWREPLTAAMTVISTETIPKQLLVIPSPPKKEREKKPLNLATERNLESDVRPISHKHVNDWENAPLNLAEDKEHVRTKRDLDGDVRPARDERVNLTESLSEPRYEPAVRLHAGSPSLVAIKEEDTSKGTPILEDTLELGKPDNKVESGEELENSRARTDDKITSFLALKKARETDRAGYKLEGGEELVATSEIIRERIPELRGNTVVRGEKITPSLSVTGAHKQQKISDILKSGRIDVTEFRGETFLVLPKTKVAPQGVPEKNSGKAMFQIERADTRQLIDTEDLARCGTAVVTWLSERAEKIERPKAGRTLEKKMDVASSAEKPKQPNTAKYGLDAATDNNHDDSAVEKSKSLPELGPKEDICDEKPGKKNKVVVGLDRDPKLLIASSLVSSPKDVSKSSPKPRVATLTIEKADASMKCMYTGRRCLDARSVPDSAFRQAPFTRCKTSLPDTSPHVKPKKTGTKSTKPPQYSTDLKGHDMAVKTIFVQSNQRKPAATNKKGGTKSAKGKNPNNANSSRDTTHKAKTKQKGEGVKEASKQNTSPEKTIKRFLDRAKHDRSERETAGNGLEPGRKRGVEKVARKPSRRATVTDIVPQAAGIQGNGVTEQNIRRPYRSATENNLRALTATLEHHRKGFLPKNETKPLRSDTQHYLKPKTASTVSQHPRKHPVDVATKLDRNLPTPTPRAVAKKPTKTHLAKKTKKQKICASLLFLAAPKANVKAIEIPKKTYKAKKEKRRRFAGTLEHCLGKALAMSKSKLKAAASVTKYIMGGKPKKPDTSLTTLMTTIPNKTLFKQYIQKTPKRKATPVNAEKVDQLKRKCSSAESATVRTSTPATASKAKRVTKAKNMTFTPMEIKMLTARQTRQVASKLQKKFATTKSPYLTQGGKTMSPVSNEQIHVEKLDGESDDKYTIKVIMERKRGFAKPLVKRLNRGTRSEGSLCPKKNTERGLHTCFYKYLVDDQLRVEFSRYLSERQYFSNENQPVHRRLKQPLSNISEHDERNDEEGSQGAKNAGDKYLVGDEQELKPVGGMEHANCYAPAEKLDDKRVVVLKKPANIDDVIGSVNDEAVLRSTHLVKNTSLKPFDSGKSSVSKCKRNEETALEDKEVKGTSLAKVSDPNLRNAFSVPSCRGIVKPLGSTSTVKSMSCCPRDFSKKKDKVVKARITEILKGNRNEEKIHKFNKNLLKVIKSNPDSDISTKTNNTPNLPEQNHLKTFLFPDVTDTKKETTNSLDEQLGRRSDELLTKEEWKKMAHSKDASRAPPSTRESPITIEKTLTTRYEVKRQPPKRTVWLCDKICLPLKSLSEAALKEPIEGMTTLNKVGDKILKAPKAPDNWTKYKNVTITHMIVKRPAKPPDEHFLPSVLKAKLDQAARREAAADFDLDDKAQMMELRYQLLRKLHKEFCSIYGEHVTKTKGNFERASRHYQQVISNSKKELGRRPKPRRRSRSVADLYGLDPKRAPSFRKVSLYYAKVMNADDQADKDKDTRNGTCSRHHGKEVKNKTELFIKKLAQLDKTSNKKDTNETPPNFDGNGNTDKPSKT